MSLSKFSIPLIVPFLLLCSSPQAAGQPAPFRVRLLGTAGPSLNLGQAEAGLLVVAGSELLLFDCGRGVPERLAQIGAIPTKVFLTHLHSDHTEGLPILWMNEVMWENRANTPLSVWGPGLGPDQPAGILEMTSQIASAFATNTHIRRDLVEMLPAGGIQFQTTVINGEGVVYSNNGVTVTAFLVVHDPVKPSYGYRIDYQGHSIVFSGDTTATPNLVKYAQGADILIHEVIISPANATTSNDAILGYHTTPEQAASIFNQVSPKLALYTHIVDQVGTTPQGLINRTRAAGYAGPLEVGQDLSLFEVGSNITVCNPVVNPTIEAVTAPDYTSTITAGGTVIVWGNHFTIGGNQVFWTKAGTTGPSIILNESDGLYFWDQSSGQINATLDKRITPGQWEVNVVSSCTGGSSAFSVTVN